MLWNRFKTRNTLAEVLRVIAFLGTRYSRLEPSSPCVGWPSALRLITNGKIRSDFPTRYHFRFSRHLATPASCRWLFVASSDKREQHLGLNLGVRVSSYASSSQGRTSALTKTNESPVKHDDQILSRLCIFIACPVLNPLHLHFITSQPTRPLCFPLLYSTDVVHTAPIAPRWITDF